MRRLRALIGATVLLAIGAVVYAQGEATRFDFGYIVLRGLAQLGTGVSLVMEGTANNDNEITITAPDPDADWTFTLPVDDGAAGEQLQTDGSGVTSWEAAGSLRDFKTLEGAVAPQEALDAVLHAPIYRFHYKRDAAITTGDFETQYVGIVADEAPWAMHHGGKILNPVNALGYTVGAIQAQQAAIDALKAELAALKGAR